MNAATRKPSRAQVQQVKCPLPYCQASPKQSCKGLRGPRLAHHQERITAFSNWANRRR